MGVTHAGTGAFRSAGRRHQDDGRQDSSDWRLQGDYFGSATRAPQPVTLSLEGGALQIAMGLLGGTLAAGTHFAKASARAAINTSPEPVSNVVTSLGEDALFAGGMWTLIHQPLLFLGALVVFCVLAVVMIVMLWRFVARIFRRRPQATG